VHSAPKSEATPSADYERPQRAVTLVGFALAVPVAIALSNSGSSATLGALWLLAFLAGLSLTGSN